MTEGAGAGGTVLGVIQAGGHGSRMDVLTRERAKPALPFGGGFRLIDFPLSSLAHAGITDVWISVQYQSRTLDRHLAHGRPWDLDRSRGGLRMMPPEEGAGSAVQSGFAAGSADDLDQMRDDIEQHGAELLVVCSADHVHNVDIARVLAAHREAGAEATMVTAEVGVTEAVHHVVVQTGADGRVTSTAEKPEHPNGGTVAAEIYVLDRRVLLGELERLRRRKHDTGADDTGLGDIALHLLPALAARGSLLAQPISGYWKDVGRPEAYLQAHRDLLRGRIDVFSQPHRPVLSAPATGLPSDVRDGATVRDSLLAPGAVVHGEVERSVLGPGVVVQAGARVVDSVLFEGIVVESGATVHTAVLDRRVRVGRDSTVGAAPRARRLRESVVTLVGADAVVRRGTTLDPGARMEPGSTT
ncbi:sugar phosphate nucleotidyltransferase [Georgenia sp. MJ173]|uniref:glucose-1-phosphate adenylyltransferase family protein n=1 Tax=Georgenia sunbinii TaxID=3117728 RepID=UPI002F2656E9